MPSCDPHGGGAPRAGRSRLGASLIRLQENLHQTRENQVVADDRYQNWLERWESRREQIAQRLELIDRQLEALVQSDDARPRLSVIAESSDTGG